MQENLYKDIVTRTQGDIYIGVVGPVRTGKSTFIKKFMDLLVIPNIKNDFKRARAMDEAPQSAGGRMIMTTEPKFIPNEAAEVSIDGNTDFRIRLIDCVGYIVPNALGHLDGEQPRMVNTPWSDEPMPFARAAEIGTKKVIAEHSTVGIVVTTDGSITDIPREDYIDAEERVASELTALKKPFVILLNSVEPGSERVIELAERLSEKYNSTVIPVNCMELTREDINYIMQSILYEFPLKEIRVEIPAWIDGLDDGDEIKKVLKEHVFGSMSGIRKIQDVNGLKDKLLDCEAVQSAAVERIDAGEGRAALSVSAPDKLFYKIVEKRSGLKINNRRELLENIEKLAKAEKEYDKVAAAMREVERKGYGIVSPTIDELTLEEPEIIRQGSRFGVRLKASAPSIHMIRADIETEVNPIVGTEKQSEELVQYLMSEFENDPKSIWNSNIFGKSLHELVNEGLHNKLNRMPDDAQMKLQETLQKIINEGSGGLICIIL